MFLIFFKEIHMTGEVSLSSTQQEAIEGFKRELLEIGIGGRVIDNVMNASIHTILYDPSLVNIQALITMARMFIVQMLGGLIANPVEKVPSFNPGQIHVYSPSAGNIDALQVYKGELERGFNCSEVRTEYEGKVLEVGMTRVYRSVAEVFGAPVDRLDQRVYAGGGRIYRPNKVKKAKSIKKK